jgi:hypothetical protein
MATSLPKAPIAMSEETILVSGLLYGSVEVGPNRIELKKIDFVFSSGNL